MRKGLEYPPEDGEWKELFQVQCLPRLVRCVCVLASFPGAGTYRRAPDIHSLHMRENFQERVSKCICELFESHGREQYIV